MHPTTQFVHHLTHQQVHKIAYQDWGDTTQNTAVLCIPGLTRMSYDFFHLAQKLCERYRIICVDLPGRGQSDWLVNDKGYHFKYYLEHIQNVLKTLGIQRVFWVGTSLGGILGMLAAASSDFSATVTHLALNDVGPAIETSALRKLHCNLRAEQGASPGCFPSVHSAAHVLYQRLYQNEPAAKDFWHQYAQKAVIPVQEAHYTYHYDPRLVQSLAVPWWNFFKKQITLWPAYQKIRSRILVVRGENSTILSTDTLQKMVKIFPDRTQVLVIPNAGHAPALSEEALQTLSEFLLT